MKANKKITDVFQQPQQPQQSSNESKNNVQTNQNIKKTKIDTISTFLDDIIKVYPKIKDDKQLIINKLTANDTNGVEYVLDKFVLPKGDYKQDDFNILTKNTEIYYIDPFNIIIDSSLKPVGIFNQSGICGRYIFFETKSILPDTFPVKYPS